jgi:hypothetical protein
MATCQAVIAVLLSAVHERVLPTPSGEDKGQLNFELPSFIMSLEATPDSSF